MTTTVATRRTVLRASAVLAAAIVGGTWPTKARAVEVGQKAPNFDLPATTGGNISLAQLRGEPVLIEFYGADFSPV
jgi:hypothetical protein